jgi:hypothetical protein
MLSFVGLPGGSGTSNTTENLLFNTTSPITTNGVSLTPSTGYTTVCTHE